jgi:hypothetical protein
MKRWILSAVVALGVAGFVVPASAKPAADNKGQAKKAERAKGKQGALKKSDKAHGPKKPHSDNRDGAKHPKGSGDSAAE